jgi:uncharacterized protein
MGNWRGLLAIALMGLGISYAWAAESSAVPQIKGRITDEAQVISPSQEHQLYQLLAQHDFARRQHLVVLTVESVGSEPLQELAKQVWQAWSYKNKARSVLLLLVKDQKSAAIVAGDELRDKLNDSAIKGVIAGKLATPLSQGDFDQAAMEGVEAIVGELNG